MSKKKKTREKEYTLLYCTVTSVLTVAIIYIIFALLLAFAVGRGKLSSYHAHYVAVTAIGISSLSAVLISIRKNRGKRFLISVITAAAVSCILLILPVVDVREVEKNVSWQSVLSVVCGCALALMFTKSIKRRIKRK